MLPPRRYWRVGLQGGFPAVYCFHHLVGFEFLRRGGGGGGGGGVGGAPDYVSSRYHRSLIDQFYLQRNRRSHRRR